MKRRYATSCRSDRVLEREWCACKHPTKLTTCDESDLGGTVISRFQWVYEALFSIEEVCDVRCFANQFG